MKNIYILYVLLLLSVKVSSTAFNSKIETNNYKNSSTIQVVSNISQLRTLNIQPTNKEIMVEVLGYYTPGDGGGGKFYYNLNSHETVNNGTVFNLKNNRKGRFLRLYSGALNVLWFGAKRNVKTTKDQARFFNNAIEFARKSGDAIFIPNGTYNIKSTIHIYEGTELYGENMFNTILKCDVSADFAIIENYSNSDSNGGRTSLKSFTIDTLSSYGIYFKTDSKHYPFTASLERIEVKAIRRGSYYRSTAIQIEGLSHAHFDTVLCKSTGTAFVLSSDKFNTGVMTFTNCQFGARDINRIGFHFAKGEALDSFVFNSCFFGATHTAELLGNGNNSVASITHNACHFENYLHLSDNEVGSSLIQFNSNNNNVAGFGAVGISWNNCMLVSNNTINMAVKFNKGYYSSISFVGTRIVNIGEAPDFYFEEDTVFKDCEISGLVSQTKEIGDTFVDKSILWENKEGWQWGWNVYNNDYFNLQNGSKTDARKRRLIDDIDNLPNDVHYNKGDIFYNKNPKKRNYIGWICVESGTSGKWRPFGKIK